MTRLWVALGLPILSFALIASAEAIAATTEISYPDVYAEPMARFPGSLGEFHFPISSENTQAQAYLELGAYDRAIEVYEQDLKYPPNKGWSLFGLQQVKNLAGQPDLITALRLKKAWARSDTWLRGNKF